MKNKNFYIKKLQIAFLAAIIAGSLILYLIEQNRDLSPVSENENFNESSFSFFFNTSSSTTEFIELNISETALYLNYFDSYSCPYYTDRADLIAPEINRLAQMFRAYGMNVIFHTHTIPSSDLEFTYKESTISKNVSNLCLNYSSLHLSDTSPLFEDLCTYEDYNSNPAPENGTIHHDIKYSTKTDLFVRNHASVLALAKNTGAKNIIVGGMKCNLWLPSLFELLKENGIKPFYLYDLSDVAYYREAQKEELKTHNSALIRFWQWVEDNYNAVVNHFELIDRVIPSTFLGKIIDYDGNEDAYYFSEFYDRDL